MPYVCQNPMSKLSQFKGSSTTPNATVANGQCVRLVQVWCGVPHTSTWQQGVRIKDALSSDIAAGTAIATFFNGVYPNNPHGNHAAIYLSHDNEGINVIDQWVNKNGGTSTRKIYFNNPSSGNSNNGDVFYVIE